MSGYLGLAFDFDDVPSSGRCLRCIRDMNCLKTYRAHAIVIVLLYTQFSAVKVSGCSSPDCFPLALYNGPWGTAVEYVQKQCYINVTSVIPFGTMNVWLWLDRETDAVTPYTMTYTGTVNDCVFTYTNPYEYHPGIYTFDMQLVYRVDGGNTVVPDGYCSLIPVTTPCPSATSSTVPPSTTLPPPTTTTTTASTTTTTPATITSTTTTATAPAAAAPAAATTTATAAASTTTTASTISNYSTMSSQIAVTQNVLQIIYSQCYGSGTPYEFFLNCKTYVAVLFTSVGAGGLLSVLIIRCCLRKRAFRRPVNNRIGVEENINYDTKSTDSRSSILPKPKTAVKITTVHEIEHSEAWLYPTLGKLSTPKVHRSPQNWSR